MKVTTGPHDLREFVSFNPSGLFYKQSIRLKESERQALYTVVHAADV